jgi:hypothetical protein
VKFSHSRKTRTFLFTAIAVLLLSFIPVPGVQTTMEIPAPPLLDQYQWKNRLLLLFAPDEEDRTYKLQLEELLKQERGLRERELLIFHIFPDSVKLPDGTVSGQADASNLRKHYVIPQKETATLLIGKDGGEKLRSRDLLTTERLFQTIDAMPMRRQEMKEQD